MKNISIILFWSVVFVSCSPEKKYATEIETITKYEKSIDSLTGIYNTIKFDSLILIQKSANRFERMIKTYYDADTISQELAKKLQYIKSVRKSLSNIEIKQESIAKELVALKDQFSTLKTDVIAGVFNSKQLDRFLKEEKLAYETLNSNISTLVNNEAKQLKDFQYASPLVSEYVEIIKLTED